MSQTTLEERYTLPAVILHWLLAVLIPAMAGLGWFMGDLPKDYPQRSEIFALHKSFGILIFVLLAVRLAWRLTHRPPALPEAVQGWQRMLAKLMHGVLYVFLLLQPLSGYLSSSFTKYDTAFFGLPLPKWGWRDRDLHEFFEEVHAVNVIVLAVLIGLHVCGALYHALKPGDTVFRRILP
ncbi:MAG: cytochrome b [Gammaproteobacteria bacterium]